MMAWSLSFTSSASSILEVGDRQPVREVQSYHKAGASLGRGVEVTSEARREPLLHRWRKAEIPDSAGASLSRCTDQPRQTHVMRVCRGGRRWGCWHRLTDKFERQRHKPFSFRSCQLFVATCAVSKAHFLINCSFPNSFFSRSSTRSPRSVFHRPLL